MTENIRTLDRRYRDRRGVIVHVIGYDKANQQVIFMRSGYEHPCCQPVWKFQKYYTEVK
ncbi:MULTISPECIES: DUF4222 domain-containing protein [unclassified Brenneria]|uniref:DUF4222 domain-containing protein n=1 Tax=unclassified Brenneria TaxID=2634434 RepID=UPI001551F588|nr:DUF4222 domain-containing protein [Brenneria sp. hezel4-2-4]MEE3649485.1 DUF4222 domain-containing protein [Brenneria sp. HEZEL_4_2_4]NPC99442.1 DUF4222 domain-containing protein [Brenneria sp. hezel4-2-4]